MTKEEGDLYNWERHSLNIACFGIANHKEKLDKKSKDSQMTHEREMG